MAKQGPLSNFWRFKFRRNPAGNEPADVGSLRAAADRFYNSINQGDSCINKPPDVSGCFDAMASPAEADRLGTFAYNNGIASKIRVHYGPGWTYDPTKQASSARDPEGEEFPGLAQYRNEEIYIQTRYR
jgi:hypothetical protein